MSARCVHTDAAAEMYLAAPCVYICPTTIELIREQHRAQLHTKKVFLAQARSLSSSIGCNWGISERTASRGDGHKVDDGGDHEWSNRNPKRGIYSKFGAKLVPGL